MAEDREPWLESLKNGDEGAFRELVKGFAGPLKRYLSGLLRDPAEAEDLTQETFLRFAQSLSDFRGDCSVRSYLYRIAHNLALNHLASASARREEVGDPPDGASPSLSPQAQALQKQRAESLRRALLSLPPQQRAVVILKTWEDLTFREIAGVLSVAEGTAKAHYFFALRNLRGRLEASHEP
ncbi:MAG: RNA polymerase sigma factor [Acidobacteriota bacterium]